MPNGDASFEGDEGGGEPAEGAAVGALVGVGLTGVAMFWALALASQSPDVLSGLLDARQAAGAVPFVAAASLIPVGAAAVGAGTGYALSGGEMHDAPAAAGGAMIGASLASLLGALPATMMFSSSDTVRAQPVSGLGDAIGTGISAGLAESFGFFSVIGTSTLLAPPAAAAGAYLAGNIMPASSAE